MCNVPSTNQISIRSKPYFLLAKTSQYKTWQTYEEKLKTVASVELSSIDSMEEEDADRVVGEITRPSISSLDDASFVED